MRISEKAKAVRNILIKTDISPGELFASYGDKKFIDGFSKFESMKQVLTGNPSKCVVDYLENRLSESQYSFMRDKRSASEYGFDILLGWILEDCLIEFLVRSGIGAVLAGCDSSREFLRRADVSTNSDAEVMFGGVSRKLELVFDQSEYWRRNNRADFRSSKFEKIIKSQSLVLGVSVKDATCFVYEAASPLSPKATYVESHPPWGGKSAYSIFNMRDILMPLDKISEVMKNTLSSLKRGEVVD